MTLNTTDRSSVRVLRISLLPLLFLAGLAASCSTVPGTGGDGSGTTGVYHNTTDPTNGNANRVGSDACRACHPSIADPFALHGHGHALSGIKGQPPMFPEEAGRAGVPDPPDGFAWTDIAYVIGGYLRDAVFVDIDGFILTTGETGAETQWNLRFPANGTQSGFAAFEPDRATFEPFEFSCFTCHTTGARPQDTDLPEFQQNRPGIIGTWDEPGVQCEACHGPGGNHIPNPSARDIFVDVSASQCGTCHARDGNPNVIQAADGFIRNNQQWAELLASGGHSGFDCTMCHEPHTSVNYDRERAIRNHCAACHADQTMAIHDGKVFVRGDYTEALSCESCHMPFATKSAAAASQDVVGSLGRVGDMRTHVFRISTEPDGFNALFTADGTAVRKQPDGRAAITVDFVCLRCHNGIGNAFELPSVEVTAGLASLLHELERSSLSP